VSQFGDIEERLESGETVSEFLRNYYGFRHEFLGVVATVSVAFPVALPSILTFRRDEKPYLKLTH
jgi:hypothetical protein